MSDANVIALAKETLRYRTTEHSQAMLLEMIRHLVVQLNDTEEALERAKKDMLSRLGIR